MPQSANDLTPAVALGYRRSTAEEAKEKELGSRPDSDGGVLSRRPTHVLRTTLIAALFLLAGVSQAAAATVTIGQLAPPPPTANCNGLGDIIQTAVAAGTAYTVPTAGTITSWSTNAATGSGQMIKMKFFRLQSGTTYTVVAHDGPQPLASGTFNEFPVNIPVQQGDVLGMHIYGTPTACYFTTGMMGDVYGFASTDTADGSPENFPMIDFSYQARLNISATLTLPSHGTAECEVPKVKGRKLRAAKRRLRNANCKLGKVRGHGKRVIKQKPKPGTTLPPGSTVNVKLG
jgi:hypothetical protein